MTISEHEACITEDEGEIKKYQEWIKRLYAAQKDIKSNKDLFLDYRGNIETEYSTDTGFKGDVRQRHEDNEISRAKKNHDDAESKCATAIRQITAKIVFFNGEIGQLNNSITHHRSRIEAHKREGRD